MGVLCVYAMFLIALSSIALAVLLALGRCSSGCCFLTRPGGFFRPDRATRQLRPDYPADCDGGRAIAARRAIVCHANCRARQRHLDRGRAHMVLIAVLVFLVLRQVMPIASGLAGGVSLHSFGIASRSLRMGRIRQLAAPALAAIAASWRARRRGGSGTGQVQRGAQSSVLYAKRGGYRSAGAKLCNGVDRWLHHRSSPCAPIIVTRTACNFAPVPRRRYVATHTCSRSTPGEESH